MPVIFKSFYQPARGGHAPSDVRGAFCEAVDAYESWEDGTPEPTVDLRDQPVPISQIFGLLWNCSDVLPGSVFRQVDILFRDDEGPRRRTYAAAARVLRPAVKAGHGEAATFGAIP